MTSIRIRKYFSIILSLALILPQVSFAVEFASGGDLSLAKTPISIATLPPLEMGDSWLPSFGAIELPPLAQEDALLTPASVSAQNLVPVNSAIHPVVSLVDDLRARGISVDGALSSPQNATAVIGALQELPDSHPAKHSLISAAQEMIGGSISHVAQNFDPTRLQQFFDGSTNKKSRLWSLFAAAASLPFIPKTLRQQLALRASRGMGGLKPASIEKSELNPAQLRWIPEPESLPVSTREVPVADKEIVGQENALKEMDFGLKMEGPGYNLYVSGPDGSGRETAVRHLLSKIAPTMPTPPDLIAVTNFTNAHHPVILQLPPGTANKFAAAVDTFLKNYPKILESALKSRLFIEQSQALHENLKNAIESRAMAFENEVSQIRLANGRFGVRFVPVAPEGEGAPGGIKIVLTYPEDGKMETFTPERRERLLASGELSEADFAQALKEANHLASSLMARWSEVLEANKADQDVANHKLSELVSAVSIALATKFAEPINHAVAPEQGQARDGYAEERALVREQVKLVALHAAQTYDKFLAEGAAEKTPPGAFYSVSVLVDNSKTQGAPVVFSNASNFASLLGSLKKNMRIVMTPSGGAIPLESEAGPSIKAGDYLKANGGFLVLPLTMDLLRQPGAWYALMRAAATGVLELGDGENHPIQIPAGVKIVLVGSPMLRNLLAEHDDSFLGNFGVVANFTSKLKINPETIDGYLQFFANSVVESDGDILPLTRGAMTALLEHSARLIASNENLSSQFGALYGLMREASYFAKEASATEISEEEVQKALSMRGGSMNLVKEWKRDNLQSGKTIFDGAGERLNQINGLAVMGDGDHMIGSSLRITSAVSPSSKADGLSIVFNDQEAGWTGVVANKSMANIRGYLEGLYGKKAPVSMRISFEQLYGGMDGDSATTAMDVLARLSVAGIPIRQDGAVTGSADQLVSAHTQIIGGVNQKIEGVFDALENRPGGLKGTEFVVIPKTNAGDLMLDPKIVKAAKDGKFHIYAIESVDQAVEVFSGMSIENVRLLEKLHLKEFAASNFISRMFWSALYNSARSLLLAMPMSVPIRGISTAQFRTNGMGPGPVQSAKPMPTGYRGPGA